MAAAKPGCRPMASTCPSEKSGQATNRRDWFWNAERIFSDAQSTRFHHTLVFFLPCRRRARLWERKVTCLFRMAFCVIYVNWRGSKSWASRGSREKLLFLARSLPKGLWEHIFRGFVSGAIPFYPVWHKTAPNSSWIRWRSRTKWGLIIQPVWWL